MDVYFAWESFDDDGSARYKLVRARGGYACLWEADADSMETTVAREIARAYPDFIERGWRMDNTEIDGIWRVIVGPKKKETSHERP